MQRDPTNIDALLPHLFRQEYAKMTAVLSRYFGLPHIEIAEDIVSETFLKALEQWAVHGVPDNPSAWLYTVAKNKTKDYIRRHQLFETTIKKCVRPDERLLPENFEFNTAAITDSQLAMIFAVCNPANTPQAQVCLALQILCGFSVEEIASAFLSKTETIKKRLLRARKNLRNDQFCINNPRAAEISERMDAVLRTLYLLFNEGYFSKTNDQLIRKDLCAEAMRLCLIIAENKLASTPMANALLALMCFQTSRIEARCNAEGDAVLYEEQDITLWDQYLIDRGNYYLIKAFDKSSVSKYHLEASIAYWHTTDKEQKWHHILQLYNQLLILEYSPSAALNRTFAFAKVYGNTAAILEARKLPLQDSSYYHGLMGYLYTPTDCKAAIAHYRQAISMSKSTSEKRTLTRQITILSIS